jgi:phosphoribosyl-ATP pyrophosphohydrolase
MSDTPLSIEQAAGNLMQALNGASHGSIGAALADMIGAIDHVAGSDLSAAAAQLISGVDLSAASSVPPPASQMQTTAPAAAPVMGDSLGAELDHLSATLAARASEDAKSSYTASLLAAGVEKCAKKLGEEAVETALAAAKGDKTALAAEAADVVYHLLVLLKAGGVSGEDVAAVLKARRGVSGLDEKASRPKE